MAPDDPVSAGSETTDAESAAAKMDSPTGFAGLIEGPLALAAAITAVLASTVGLLYVIGGTVMWLRFHEANLPADRAVALVPKNDLLILGLRVMVIPAPERRLPALAWVDLARSGDAARGAGAGRGGRGGAA